MSIEAVAAVLHHSRAKGAAKLVMVGIANHDGDGGSWPSMATLAKYAGVTPDQARRLVRRLEELGEVRVMTQAGGTMDTPDHLRPNRYLVRIQCPASCDGTTRHRDRNVLFGPPEPVDNLWIDPPVNPLSPIRGTAPMRAEPSSRTTNHMKDTYVPERARVTRATHDNPRTGRPCQGTVIDGRHCDLGCLITTEGHDDNAD